MKLSGESPGKFVGLNLVGPIGRIGTLLVQANRSGLDRQVSVVGVATCQS